MQGLYYFNKPTMKYLIISNQGEIKEQALTKVGLSTKRNDNGKIGRFGSGNK